MSKTGFLFPGQGAQFVGMGRDLAASLPAARRLFDQANDVLGYDLAKICFEGPPEKLNATEHCQPALLVCSMASLEQLKQEHPAAIDACQLAAGLSLGEYSALCFAGAITFPDALRVVQIRGNGMQAASDARPSGMVAVLGIDAPRLEQLCDEARIDGGVLRIANYLCPGNIVCSGDQASCDRLAQLATDAGAMKVVPLAVAGAFHTSLMQPAVEALSAALAEVTIQPPHVAIVSNVDAQPHSDPEEIRELLVRQVVTPVQWEASMGAMISAGVDEFHEVGAGKVLRGLMRRINRKIPVQNV